MSTIVAYKNSMFDIELLSAISRNFQEIFKKLFKKSKRISLNIQMMSLMKKAAPFQDLFSYFIKDFKFFNLLSCDFDELYDHLFCTLEDPTLLHYLIK